MLSQEGNIFHLRQVIQRQRRLQNRRALVINPKRQIVPLNRTAQLKQTCMLQNGQIFNQGQICSGAKIPQINSTPILADTQSLRVYFENTFDITQSHLYPYSPIGVVTGATPLGQVHVGTGFIFGPQLVATVAHNCYSFQHRQQYEPISFTPGILWKYGERQAYQAKKVHYPQQIKYWDVSLKEKLFLYDFALIELNTTENLEDIYGSYGYEFHWASNFQKPFVIEKAMLIGLKKEDQDFIMTQLSGDMRIDGQLLTHNMKTGEGASGSPILEVIQGQHCLRGIHNTKVVNCNFQYRTGVSITPRVLQFYQNKLNVLRFQFNGLAEFYGSQYNVIALEGLKYFANFYMKHSKDLRELIYINLIDNRIGDEGCRHLKELGCQNLRTLNLLMSEIADEGCRYLSEACWPSLQELMLGLNRIGPQGCLHLKNAHWPSLYLLFLRQNHIGDTGCQYLSQARWVNMQQLGLGDNSIGNQGCLHLVNARWANIQNLFLWKNDIGSEGCRWLSKAKWDSIQGIFLNGNKIGISGCKHLIDIRCPATIKLVLANNDIDNTSCFCLSNMYFPNLRFINLKANHIGDLGLQALVQAKWAKLEELLLGQNQIGDKGCQHFLRSNWPHLKEIYLGNNLIQDQGCFHLAKAERPQLTKLKRRKLAQV